MTEKLTPKQKAFADYYIETGNATEAARRAGYSEKTAVAIGNENLRKPNIAAYIAERVKPTEEKRIATGDEVMKFFTSVMRGEIKDAFDLPPSLDERQKAARELAKRTVDLQQGNSTADEIVKGIVSLADILKNPAPNRNIEDFE